MTPAWTKRLLVAVSLSLTLGVFGGVAASATPDPEGDGHKVGICHRTASDSNPYVYIEVDEASLSPGHLDNADPGHKPTFWKSDGTFRGVAHVDGDPKDDYLAPNGASDCVDFVTTTTVTTTTAPPTCEETQTCETTTTVPPTTTTTTSSAPPSTTTTATTTTTAPTEPPTTSPPPSTTVPPKHHGQPNKPPKQSPRKLAFTGFEDVAPVGALALALLTLGSGALWLGRRRRDVA